MALDSRNVARCLRVLGLNAGATEDEIKKSYKKLALLHHPDKNTEDPRATKKFQELSEAYTYLMKTDDDEQYEEKSAFEEDLDLLDLLRLFAHLNASAILFYAARLLGTIVGCCIYCLAVIHSSSSTWWHGRSSHVYYDDDDYYDEPMYFDIPSCGRTKPKRYSDRYQSSCDQQDYCHCDSNGAGENPKSWNRKSSSAPPEVDKATREARKDEKLRQRLEQEAKELKERKKTESPANTEVHSEPSRGQQQQTDGGQAKKLTKKQLLAEQRRREKEMAAIAEELQEQCRLATEKTRQKEEEKRPVLKETPGEDDDSEADDITPSADVIKPEGRKVLGPTKSRRKREAKQKRRLARSENKSNTTEITGATTFVAPVTVPSQAYKTGILPAQRYSVADDEDWTDECDPRPGNNYYVPSPANNTPAIYQPECTSSESHTGRNQFPSSHTGRNQFPSPHTDYSKTTAVPSVVDGVKHNNQFRSTSSERCRYNESFASGFWDTRSGDCDGATDWTPETTGDWAEQRHQIVTDIRCPKDTGRMRSNSHVASGNRADDLSSFDDIIDRSCERRPVINGVTTHGTGYAAVAPPTWSEPSREPAKNVWSEREQFVNEALPQNREEEEEMLRVALEMSKLQEQEDTLRRQMWEQELAMYQCGQV